jgi:hypothetical protein
MLKTGRDFLRGLKDGRVVYVGGEQVEDRAQLLGMPLQSSIASGSAANMALADRSCRAATILKTEWWVQQDSNLRPAD